MKSSKGDCETCRRHAMIEAWGVKFAAREMRILYFLAGRGGSAPEKEIYAGIKGLVMRTGLASERTARAFDPLVDAELLVFDPEIRHFRLNWDWNPVIGYPKLVAARKKYRRQYDDEG